MSDQQKTKAQLIEELTELRQEVARLKAIEQEALELEHRSEKALRQAEARYELLFDTVPVAIYTKDLEGRYTSVNADTLTYWTRNPIGYTDAEILSKEIATKLRMADLQVIETEQELVVEEDLQTPHGLRTVLSRKIPLCDAGGNVIGILGTSLDITERREVEEALVRRASELEAIAQVGTAAATILDINELLQTVVDRTKEQLDLYHAHIYLVDPRTETLNLAAGAGEVGRQMVADGWCIPLAQEQSLVARAARQRSGVIVNDVRADPGFFQNPLLPNTRSEMAVPMIVGGELLGILDVQSDVANRFTEEDIRLKSILASQIAVALQNARLYAQTQRRVERERLVNTISQKIQSTVTVESALQTAVRELGWALQAAYTRIELTRPGEVAQSGQSVNGSDGATHDE